ncbi:alginate O-acetyltransferase AlgX-related protein [Aquabacter spiritensis]|uniref:Acetyltransferase AlgX (SGNH hydrolase-like protein) n=1 Tax=Aquabacter spiritensis TaxID=933073 RepID=A0A4R3M4L4_9HYPH|nr:hypothetical protein [Aquabacter spiritensis]TCT07786.1 acetyltransferase AlgX (SGNH hydrolase-like protein) [Aquabacter spiritensis]
MTMPLLLAYRRWWCLIFAGVLLLPTLGHVLPDIPGPARPVIAPAERWWMRATERLDPFINANFGFRGVIMAANAGYARAFDSTRARPVAIGADGQLFYTGDRTMDQALGLLVRRPAMAALGETLARLQATLKPWDGRLVVMPMPNAAAIIPEKLPDWARGQMRTPTEFDLAAEDAARRGLAFVDLRPILTAAKAAGPVYRRTDTHWTQRAALIAFNAAMAAAGRPDLEIPESAAIGPLQAVPSGDLARYLGDADPRGDRDYAERDPLPKATLVPLSGLVPERPANDPFRPYAYSTGHDGPSILVIGDSFTQHYWPRLLAARTSRFGWMTHEFCRFDWGAIARFKPDIVIYGPTERSLPCKIRQGE